MSSVYDISYLARMEKFNQIKRIFNRNPLHPVDNRDKNGKTGFMHAAANNNLEMMKFFIFQGAQTDIVDNDNNDALALAVKNDSEDTASFLINLGMDVDIMVNNDSTLLHSAIGNENARLAFLILKNKGDPTKTNYRGLDAYQLAQKKLENKEVEKFEILLEELGWI